jgi:hypothetical protein
MTAIDHVVRYREHVSSKSYDELVAAFEAGVADGTGRFSSVFQEASSSENSRQVWESGMNNLAGPAGFLYVLTVDFGQLVGWYGVSAKAKMWLYGHPVIAATMARKDIRVAGQVPLQILIYEGDDGAARIGYDLPSSMLSWLGNAEVDAVASELDKKVIGFVTEIAGVSA